MGDYLRLRQVCLAAPRLEPLAEDLEAILGVPVCHRDENLAKYGLENVLFAVGTGFLEIVAPIQSGTAVERFIQRSGGRGGYMAIFDCADPEARALHAESLGVRRANVIQQNGYHSVQLHPRDCRAAMIEFGHTPGGERLDGPYWPAGADWMANANPEQALMGIELESPDPHGLMRHWASILQLPAPAQDGAPCLVAGAARIAARQSGDPRERLAAVDVQVQDPARAAHEAGTRSYSVAAGAFPFGGVMLRLTESPGR
ncbi:hypothetical protein HC341_11425 [Aquisalimonas sp. 2447]|uniref:hypothetical protein n=1 Tax=Aquisalimonas sp. 2447 TaxID=2740807 RepID=UPI00143232B9|nr:hypothetical protein [Aquisalimonas sp. 2447]QIT55767.1 hypothetical protein HC341_11425 [Aquisalimonas sp. 2447]